MALLCEQGEAKRKMDEGMDVMYPGGYVIASIKLTLGLAVTPRTRALFDGTVQPEGIQLRCENQFGDGLDNTGLAAGRSLAASETVACSTSSMILARSRCQMQQGLLSCQPVLEELFFSRNLEQLEAIADPTSGITLSLEPNTQCAQKSNFQHSLNEAMPSS
jgi:hypothetical protein